MPVKKLTTHGGARPGSGPKPKPPEEKAVTVSVSLVPVLAAALDTVRGEKSRAEWLRDQIPVK